MAKRMKLREVNVDDGINRPYCGPYAVMVATGYTYRKVRAAFNKLRGRKSKTHITGVYTSELVTVLINMGYTVQQKSISGKPTLKAWIDRRSKDDKASFCIVQLSTHFVVIKGNGFIDNHTREIVRLDDAPHLRKRVKKVLYVY